MTGSDNLPPGWVWTTLAGITEPTREGVRPAAYPGLVFIGMEHVEAETMRLTGGVPANEMKSNALHFLPGDVLYGRLRPYLNKVFRSDFAGLCSAEFIVFRDSHHLDSRYLQYFLNSWGFRDFAAHLNTGDRPRVDWEQLKGHPIPLPPLPEQRRIVAAIEAQFTRLDAGVAALKRAQARLKRYRAAVLKAAVEGRLTAEWRATHPTAEPAPDLLRRILAERRARWEADMRAKGKDPAKARYQEPAVPDVEGLPALPQGWAWATVDECTEWSLYGPRFSSDAYSPEGVPVIRTIDIDGRGAIDLSAVPRLSLTTDQIGKYQLLAGDLVVTRTGSIGRCAVFPGAEEPCIPGAYLLQFRLLSTLVDPYYVLQFLLADPGQRQLLAGARAVTQANINAPTVKRIVLPLPPLAEQEQIVAEVERRLSVVSELEATVQASLKRAERLRQSILREAFAGRLVPRDPTDEPASVLLARIRAEQETRQHGKGTGGAPRQVRLWEAE